MAEVVEHYRQRGLEGSFAPPAGVAATADAGLAAMQPLHWLRPGLLCLAAVTGGGQLLLACSGRGVDSASGWVLAPPVELPLLPPAPAADSSPEAPLLLADVAPGPGATLLVAAAGAAAAAGPGQVALYEVTGLPPPLVDHSRAHQQQHAARLVRIEAAAAAPDAAALSLAFLPSGAHSSRRRLLVICSSGSGGGGTTAAVFTCCSGDIRCDSSQWSMAAGASVQLCAAQLAAVMAAACQDGATLALLLLPGPQQQQQLLCLSSRGDDYGIRLRSSRPPLHVPLAHSAAAGGPAGSPAAAGSAVAVSPNGLFAAVATGGGSALLLLPLLEQPGRAAEVDAFMLEIGKR